MKVIPMIIETGMLSMIATGCIEISNMTSSLVCDADVPGARVDVSNLTCSSDSLTQATIVSIPLPKVGGNNCNAVNISANFDAGWAEGSPQLKYVKERNVELGSVPIPIVDGVCFEMPIGGYFCISPTHVFVHPKLVPYQVSVTVDDKVVASGVSTFITPIQQDGIKLSDGNVIIVSAVNEEFRSSFTVGTSDPTQSSGLLYLLILLLLIPIGYFAYRAYRKKGSEYTSANAVTPVHAV
jgi:hypothetical protein